METFTGDRSKLHLASIVVGTCLHLVACLAGVVMVLASKTRSEAALAIIGFCLPFAMSGGLLGITQGIKQPVATAVLSATLTSTLALALIQFATRMPTGVEFALFFSVLLSASAAFSTGWARKTSER